MIKLLLLFAHFKNHYKTVTRREYILILSAIDENVFTGKDEDNNAGQGKL